MSLTQGLASPRTPLRRFLDRELSAGSWPLRATFRARLPPGRLVLPGEGVGFEAGTVGTAIDLRLRLAFTAAAPVDAATALGVAHCRAVASEPGPFRRDNWNALAKVGQQLLTGIMATVADLDLDARGEPMLRSDEDEQRLARMLLAAAWYALSYRVPIAFTDTPLFQAAIQHPRRFTLKTLLEVPHRDLVADVQAQLDLAEASPLAALRARSTAGQCSPGPVFDGSADVTADADLIVDGVLIDFKSTRRVHDFPLVTMHQLLGYVLMDYSDQYEIDEVGMYLTRAGALVTWPLEDYLALLGTRRRDLGELRTAFAALLGYRGCRADNDPLPEQQFGVDQLLADLAPVIPDKCCCVCGVPLAQNMFRSNARKYCSRFCSGRAHTLRRHGWLGLTALPDGGRASLARPPPVRGAGSPSGWSGLENAGEAGHGVDVPLRAVFRGALSSRRWDPYYGLGGGKGGGLGRLAVAAPGGQPVAQLLELRHDRSPGLVEDLGRVYGHEDRDCGIAVGFAQSDQV